jgi:hypothetical protein
MVTNTAKEIRREKKKKRKGSLELEVRTKSILSTTTVCYSYIMTIPTIGLPECPSEARFMRPKYRYPRILTTSFKYGLLH